MPRTNRWLPRKHLCHRTERYIHVVSLYAGPPRNSIGAFLTFVSVTIAGIIVLSTPAGVAWEVPAWIAMVLGLTATVSTTLKWAISRSRFTEKIRRRRDPLHEARVSYV